MPSAALLKNLRCLLQGCGTLSSIMELKLGRKILCQNCGSILSGGGDSKSYIPFFPHHSDWFLKQPILKSRAEKPLFALALLIYNRKTQLLIFQSILL